MGSLDKTESIRRENVSIDLLVVNSMNPNKMKAREFDLLVDNIQRTGLTDPILVRPIEDGKYRIVGGHHRFDAAKYLDFKEVPCTIITDVEFDDDAEKFQLVRMNAIHGKLDPEAFFKLYNSMAGKYQDDVLQESFGFADDKEFQRLIAQMSKDMPDDMKKKFKAAAKEVKTIDGLAKLMNELYTKYGDTLPYGFMVIDFGGKESIWLQVTKPTMKAAHAFGEVCRANKRSMDDMMGALMQSIALPEAAELLASLLAMTPEMVIPDNVGDPTKNNIHEANQF